MNLLYKIPVLKLIKNADELILGMYLTIKINTDILVLKNHAYYSLKIIFTKTANVSNTKEICFFIASPRLAGGASRTEGRYFLNNDVLENVEMCSRGPVVVKPTLQRGACPAELEDKLATYGNSTKQLVGFKQNNI